MQLVYGYDDAVAVWVSAKLGEPISPPYVGVGAVDGNGDAVGGAVFSQWNGANLEISLYGPGVLKRHLIRQIYEYAFDHCGALRLSARTRWSNATMRRLFPRLGFEYEGTLKHFFGPSRNDDALMFRLTPETARKWMK